MADVVEKEIDELCRKHMFDVEYQAESSNWAIGNRFSPPDSRPSKWYNTAFCQTPVEVLQWLRGYDTGRIDEHMDGCAI